MNLSMPVTVVGMALLISEHAQASDLTANFKQPRTVL